MRDALPLGWRFMRLDELGTVERGRSRHRPRNDPALYGGRHPFVQTGDIKAAGLRLFEYTQTYSEVGLAQSRLWPPGTLCITIAANICDTTILGIPACFPDSIVGFTAAQTIADTVFVKYALDHAKRRFADISRGATQDNLSLEKLLSQKLPVPPLDQQRRIASILGAYDDLIEVNRRRIAVLEEMARRLFEEWFVHFRFPGRNASERSEEQWRPSWKRVALNDLCERITDGAHHSPQSVDHGYCMASVKDMRQWDLYLAGCRQISPSDFTELIRMGCQPLPGDILIAKDGANLNKHTILVTEELPVVLLSSIAIIRPKQSMPREFLLAQLKSQQTSDAIRRMRSGAAIPRIVLKDFKRLELDLPPLELQQRFDNLALPLHQLCRRLSAACDKLALQRDLLLPRLMSGELSLPAAERELEAVA